MTAALLLIVLVVFAVAMTVFFCYLLWNRRTKDYFSHQSVMIRQHHRRRR
ncbi:MAG: hypothetical protein QM658_06880 [Gordonia sp. (in: high G+C Gram-positive bacteria)]